MTIALQILEGHERGRTYNDLPLPITIGREEDNGIRLNDERASRFHAKIQSDDGRIILTDLDSTNGTRVNGHIVQMRVLQPGDQIMIGRSLIAFWLDETPSRAEATVDESVIEGLTRPGFAPEPDDSDSALTQQRHPTGETNEQLFPDGPPPLPRGLSIAQVAELSDVLSYLHQGLMSVAMSSYSGEETATDARHTIVPAEAWHHHVTIQRAIAEYLAKASDPQ